MTPIDHPGFVGGQEQREVGDLVRLAHAEGDLPGYLLRGGRPLIGGSAGALADPLGQNETGQMAFTRTPWRAYYAAMDRVMAMMLTFAAD